MTEKPKDDGARYRIPHNNLTAVREPWPVARLRGLRIYLGWWWADVWDDITHMLGRR